MKKFDFIKMGIKNLWRRKLRTILTVVGVVVGTFSIVIMMSLGIAMNEGYKQQIMQMGSLTKITVNQYNYVYDEKADMGMSQEKKLDDALVESIKKIPHVKAVTPILNIGANLKSGKYQSYINIVGIDPTTIQYFDFPELTYGNYLTENETSAILFGAGSYSFYNPKQTYWRPDSQPTIDLSTAKVDITFDNTWDTTKIPKYDKLQIAGILAASNDESNYSAYANMSQVKKWKKEQDKNNNNGKNVDTSYQSIWISADDIKYVATVQDTLKEMGYSSYSLADMLDDMQETSNMLQLILGGIGAVSLLVSAIGIANTMVMSIYERTKEIGIMKVLGCLVTDIRKLFLLEASLIGFLGGFLGIGLSYLASHLLNKYAPQLGNFFGNYSGYAVSVIPVWLAVVAVVFAMFVGIVSGLYPARRATKIKALEAMRTES